MRQDLYQVFDPSFQTLPGHVEVAVYRLLLSKAPFLTLGLALVLCPPAVAQRFGQWSWNASLSAGQGRFETELEGESLDSSTQENLWLSLGLVGYIVHPSIARFEVLTDLRTSRSSESALKASDDIGLKVDLTVLPRSSHPSLVYFEHRLFDFTLAPEVDGPFLLRGLPDTLTRWGGRTGFARGFLKGLTAGLELTTVDYADPGSGQEEINSQFLDWSRNGRRINHSVRLEHREQNLALRMGFDDIILGVIEQGDLGKEWDWHLSASGYRRTVDVAGDSGFSTRGISTEIFRVDNNFNRPLGDDRLGLRQNLGFFSSPSGSVTDAGLVASYDWRLKSDFTLSPFGSYMHQSSEEGSVSEPRLGIGFSWVRKIQRLRLLANTRASYGQRERTVTELSEEDRTLAYAATFSFSHFTPSGFEDELEAEAVHNELRQLSEPLTDLPDLGLRRNFGAEDSYRVRLSARKKWRRYSVSSYGQWQRREALNEGDLDRAFDSETVTLDVGLSGPLVTFSANAGMTDIFQTDVGDQQLDTLSLSLRLRLRNYLHLTALWRTDTRRLALLPDFDGDRLEVEAKLRIGEIYLSGKLYEVRRIQIDGSERVDHGLGWSISRGIAGWLPIVSGVERRGTIR